MSTRQSAVKRYVVTLSAEERERLEALIRTRCKHSARKLLRARILLKARRFRSTVEALTDTQHRCGLHTSLMTVARVRQQLVEEGIDGVLTPKRSAEFCQTADFRRRQRSEADRSRLNRRHPKALRGGRCRCWRARSSN